MHSLLLEFLNHGILPFAGRSAELERLTAFWQGAMSATGLRAALILGEAGMGKSRLIEEWTPRIAQSGGTVLTIRLYPESAAPIVSLIARAIRLATARRQFAIDRGSESVASVIGGVRQLARLRPTLLVFDDIHLLSNDRLAEFAHLAELLADEPVSIIGLARPVELPARAALEPFIAEEITLHDLDDSDLAELWRRLFEAEPDHWIIRGLESATHGNPLAVRSALRGAVRSGTIVFDQVSGNWRSTVPVSALGQTLKRNVELLSEGMLAHLTEPERNAAGSLAALGEQFAPEAAQELPHGAAEMIGPLIRKGILAPVTAGAKPLYGADGSRPTLAFAQSMLHAFLLAQTAVEASELIRLVASETPLYSVVPFRILAQGIGTPAPAESQAALAIRRALAGAIALDGSANWQLAAEVWGGAVGIKSICTGIWSADEERTLQAEILGTRLTLLRRSDDNAEYESVVNQLLAITEEPLPEGLRKYRLKALSFLHTLGRRGVSTRCHVTWTRAQEFIERNPDLRFDREYLAYLESAARSMLFLGDFATLAAIERELTALSSAEEGTDAYHAHAQQIIAFQFLDIFATEEELERRLRLLEEVERQLGTERRMALTISKIILCYTTGRMQEVLNATELAIPLFEERSLPNNYFYGSLSRLGALSALGRDFAEIAIEVERLCAAAPADMDPFAHFARLTLIEQAVLRGTDTWLRQALEHYAAELEHLRPETLIVLALELGGPRSAIGAAIHQASNTFKPFVEEFTASPPDPAAVYTALKLALGAPVLRLSDLLEKRALLAAVPELAERLGVAKLADAFQDALRDALRKALAWLDDRGLPSYMTPFLDRHEALLPQRERSKWRARMAEHERRQGQAPQPELPGARIRLTMLGSIELQWPDAAPMPIRGTRLRTLVGLLVADRMLDEPLDHREFSSIVAGTDDPDKARKTLNGVVFRLREILGHETITTQEETPRLNHEMIEVDLLEANGALGDAAAAMREGSLARAQRLLLQVLAITRGQLPFPALYDNFFEATREHFETRLRTLLLKVARGLLAEGDPQNAEELLRGGFAAMAGDEEIAELLCDALIVLGKRAEAERVRMRMME